MNMDVFLDEIQTFCLRHQFDDTVFTLLRILKRRVRTIIDTRDI